MCTHTYIASLLVHKSYTPLYKTVGHVQQQLNCTVEYHAVLWLLYGTSAGCVCVCLKQRNVQSVYVYDSTVSSDSLNYSNLYWASFYCTVCMYPVCVRGYT